MNENIISLFFFHEEEEISISKKWGVEEQTVTENQFFFLRYIKFPVTVIALSTALQSSSKKQKVTFCRGFGTRSIAKQMFIFSSENMNHLMHFGMN